MVPVALVLAIRGMFTIALVLAIRLVVVTLVLAVAFMGGIDSLNVAIAGGILMYLLARK